MENLFGNNVCSSAAIDLGQVRRHIELNADEKEAVRARRTVFTMARTAKGPRSRHFQNSHLLKLIHGVFVY